MRRCLLLLVLAVLLLSGVGQAAIQEVEAQSGYDWCTDLSVYALALGSPQLDLVQGRILVSLM